jgi:hypothetical protein
MVFDQLHHLAGQSFTERSRALGVLPILSVEQSRPEHVLDVLGKGPEILNAGTNEVEWFAVR